MIVKNEGYIAVVSAAVVTLMILGISVLASTSGFLGYVGTQGLEMKDLSINTARGCLNHSRLRLAEGSYGGSETVNVGSQKCEILPIETAGSTFVIKASSTVRGASTMLKLTVDDSTLETISLEEVVSF